MSRQATDVCINKEGWIDQKRPFTFTNLPSDEYLEFTIKVYPDHKGVTNELLNLREEDELIIHDVWGAISYKGEGLFIAGGAGITPFLSIFRWLKSENKIGNNKLIFANKFQIDIIQESELRSVLGEKFINILSRDDNKKYIHGFINEKILKENLFNSESKIYMCGPPPMMEAIQKYLDNLGIGKNSLVVEI